MYLALGAKRRVEDGDRGAVHVRHRLVGVDLLLVVGLLLVVRGEQLREAHVLRPAVADVAPVCDDDPRLHVGWCEAVSGSLRKVPQGTALREDPVADDATEAQATFDGGRGDVYPFARGYHPVETRGCATTTRSEEQRGCRDVLRMCARQNPCGCPSVPGAPSHIFWRGVGVSIVTQTLHDEGTHNATFVGVWKALKTLPLFYRYKTTWLPKRVQTVTDEGRNTRRSPCVFGMRMPDRCLTDV